MGERGDSEGFYRERNGRVREGAFSHDEDGDGGGGVDGEGDVDVDGDAAPLFPVDAPSELMIELEGRVNTGFGTGTGRTQRFPLHSGPGRGDATAPEAEDEGLNTAFVELSADAGAAGLPEPPPVFTPERGPPEPGPGSFIPLADMLFCINEGSRQLVYSLFRGIVGPTGQIECRDVEKY